MNRRSCEAVEGVRGGMALCTLAAASFALLAVSLGGCGFSPDMGSLETESEAVSLINVGFSQLGSESVWRTANTVSIQNALSKENGYFLQFSNARQKQENQIKALRGFISQRVDYIVFAPVTETGWDTVLGEAKEAEVPVIVVDRTVSVRDDSLYQTWIGSDMEAEGEKAGKWLEEELEKEGRQEDAIRIAVLRGTVGSSAQIGRTQGFRAIAGTHPNWNILAEREADFTTARGAEVMEEILKTYGAPDVVVSQNDDMTLGAIDTMEKMGYEPGRDILVISFDSTKEALRLVQQGKISVDVECNPLQGPVVSSVIRKLENGESVGKENKVSEMVFTAQNVGEYIDGRVY